MHLLDALAVAWIVTICLVGLVGAGMAGSVTEILLDFVLYTSPAVAWLAYSIYQNSKESAKSHVPRRNKVLVIVAVLVGIPAIYLILFGVR